MSKKKYKTVKDLLSNPKRWCKERYRDDNGAYCLYGAVLEVYEGMKQLDVLDDIRDAIAKLYPSARITSGDIHIEEFNDAPRRTHKQIMRVLEKANV